MEIKDHIVSRSLFACVIGNILEWYEFMVFGYFAGVLGQVFFEPSSPLVGMFKIFGIFAVGVLVRPLGGIFLGHIGDRWGRKSALVVSMILMSVPTFLIGCLPTYATLGAFASIALLVIRILQGLAMGGEYAGAMVYLVEKSQPAKRGWYGSIAALSLVIGMALGSFVSGLLHALLTEQHLYEWGWRIPFFISFLGLVWGLYLRATLDETVFFYNLQQQKAISKFPLKDIFTQSKSVLVSTVISQYFLGVGMYTMTVFYANYALNLFKDLDKASLLLINTPGVLCIGLAGLIGGKLSDCWRNKKMLVLAAFSAIVVNILVIPLMELKTIKAFLWAHILMAIATGLFLGPIPSFLSQSFPANTRYTGVALSNNLSMGIFGGTAPMIITYLLTLCPGHPIPNYYLIVSASLSLVGLGFTTNINFLKTKEI